MMHHSDQMVEEIIKRIETTLLATAILSAFDDPNNVKVEISGDKIDVYVYVPLPVREIKVDFKITKDESFT